MHKTIPFALFLVMGCGTGQPEIHSCDYRPSPRISESSCTDYEQITGSLDALSAACKSVGGAWSDGPCDHKGALGGCRHKAGYYDDNRVRVTEVEWWWQGDLYKSYGAAVVNCTASFDHTGQWVDP